MKREYINIGRLQFLKDCAKGMSFDKFKKDFAHYKDFNFDFEKGYVILGGEIESKKIFKKKVEKK